MAMNRDITIEACSNYMQMYMYLGALVNQIQKEGLFRRFSIYVGFQKYHRPRNER